LKYLEVSNLNRINKIKKRGELKYKIMVKTEIKNNDLQKLVNI